MKSCILVSIYLHCVMGVKLFSVKQNSMTADLLFIIKPSSNLISLETELYSVSLGCNTKPKYSILNHGYGVILVNFPMFILSNWGG